MSTKKKSATVTAKPTGPVGVVIVTHADYGEALLRAAAFILGPLDQVKALGVDASQEVDATRELLLQTVGKLDAGSGVLVLTDMFGGTPTNLSLSLLSACNVEVVTGVNMPMVIKALSNRTEPLEVLARQVKDAGGQGIVVAGELLRKKVAGG